MDAMQTDLKKSNLIIEKFQNKILCSHHNFVSNTTVVKPFSKKTHGSVFFIGRMSERTLNNGII